MDAYGSPKTVKVSFAKRMPDGEARQSAPLCDSTAGFTRVGHMLSYARRVRDERESGAFSSPDLCELEPNSLLTAYIAAAYHEYERGGGSLPLDTMAVGDCSWLGCIQVVEEVVLDLDDLLADDAVHKKSGWEWAC